MSVEKAVRAILLDDAKTVAHVSSRIFPQRRPQGTPVPAIVYQNVFEEENQALAEQGGIKRTRLSLELFYNTYSGNKALIIVVVGALVNYTGEIEGTTIDNIRLENSIDIDETNTPGSDFGFFRTILDFVIWHQ